MKKTTFKYLFIFSLFVILQSCVQNTAKDIKNWIDAYSNTGEVSGKHTLLPEDGIKVFLPHELKKYPLLEYQKELKTLISEDEYAEENKRLQFLRKMEGNFHVFYDSISRSTYTMNTMPYQPITKRDAQYLLGMIRVNNEAYAENSEVKFTKLTAKYRNEFGPQIFKVVHRIDHLKTNLTTYNATYIVSYNKKTVYIQLATAYEVDFDPYLNKMIM